MKRILISLKYWLRTYEKGYPRINASTAWALSKIIKG